MMSDSDTYELPGEDQTEANLGILSGSLLKTAVVIDHAADYVKQASALDKETTEQVKLRALGAVVGLIVAGVVLCLCIVFLALNSLRRRAHGYRKTAIGDEVHDQSDEDEEWAVQTPIEAKVGHRIADRVILGGGEELGLQERTYWSSSILHFAHRVGVTEGDLVASARHSLVLCHRFTSYSRLGSEGCCTMLSLPKAWRRLRQRQSRA